MVKKCMVWLLLLSILVVSPAFCPVQAQEHLLEIVINIPQFKLYLYENQMLVKEYPIGVGTEIKPSILGQTQVINLVRNPTYYPLYWWERGLEPIPPGPDNPVGTRWIGLGFPSYGIHGTNNPASIGKAVSSGCIRMYNADVEELMDLISIGTPVALIYQTILVNQDPLLNTKTITLLPDIYQNGSNTVSRAKQIFSQRQWDDIHLPALEFLLANSVGRSMPLPLVVDIKYNDEVLECKAVKYGMQYYIPVNNWEIGFTEDFECQDVVQWDGSYVNLAEFAHALGLGYQVGPVIELFRVETTFFDQPLEIEAFFQDDQVYIPIDELAQQAHVPVPDNLESHIVVVAGKPCLGLAGLVALGITVHWDYPARRVRLEMPLAYLDGQYLGVALTAFEEDIYVPLTPVLQLISATQNKEDGAGLWDLPDLDNLDIRQINGEPYAPQWAIRWLLPGAELTIIYPE